MTPSPRSGLIAYKADFVSFLTRRSSKVLGGTGKDQVACGFDFAAQYLGD